MSTTMIPKEGWTPPASATDHLGGPIRTNDLFFAPPPPQIGSVVSANSTMGVNSRPWPLWLRRFVIVLATGAGIGIGVWINLSNGQKGLEYQSLGLCALIGISGFAIAYTFTNFQHICTYVGSQGFSIIRCYGSREGVEKPELFLFIQASALKTELIQGHGLVDRALLGPDREPHYAFSWTTAAGKVVHEYSGQLKHDSSKLPGDDLYYFYCSAEKAWTAWRLEQALKQINESGSFGFKLDDGGEIRVAAEYAEFLINGRRDRVPREAFQSLQMHGRQVVITIHLGSVGLPFSDGQLVFEYDDIENAQLLQRLFRKCVLRER